MLDFSKSSPCPQCGAQYGHATSCPAVNKPAARDFRKEWLLAKAADCEAKAYTRPSSTDPLREHYLNQAAKFRKDAADGDPDVDDLICTDCGAPHCSHVVPRSGSLRLPDGATYSW